MRGGAEDRKSTKTQILSTKIDWKSVGRNKSSKKLEIRNVGSGSGEAVTANLCNRFTLICVITFPKEKTCIRKL